MIVFLPAGSGAYGLTDYTDGGTVGAEETMTVDIPSNIVGFKSARLARTPVNGSVNETWISVRLNSSNSYAPQDFWMLSIGGRDVLFRDMATLDMSQVDVSLDTYALFVWGCETGDRVPENCRWLKPHVFSLEELSEYIRPGPDGGADENKAGFGPESLNLPSSVSDGDTFTVSATVANQGSSRFSDTIQAQMYDASGEQVDVGTQAVSVSGGGSQSVSIDLALPEGDGFPTTPSCHVVELRCPTCDRLSGLSGTVGNGCIGQVRLPRVSAVHSQTVSRSLGDSISQTVRVQNEGDVGAVVELTHDVLSQGDEEAAPDDIGEKEQLVYVPPTSYRDMEATVPVEDDEDQATIGWGQTELECDDFNDDGSDDCIAQEPSISTACIDASNSVDQFTVWMDGQEFVYEGGPADSDEQDWLIQGQGSPVDMEARDGATLLFEAPEPVPEGAATFTFTDEDGGDETEYHEGYNWRGKKRVAAEFTARDAADDHEVTYSWGCGSVTATIEVDDDCEDGRIFPGDMCKDQSNILDLVAVPLHYEQEEFTDFAAAAHRQVQRFAHASPLREADEEVPQHRIVLHFMEPEDSESNPDLEEPERNNGDVDYGCSRLNDKIKTAVQNEDDLSAIKDKIMGVTGADIHSGGNYDAIGCAPLFDLTEVTEGSSSTGVASQELGHAFGMCHTEGVQDGGTCQSDAVPQETYGRVAHHQINKPHCPGSGPEEWTACKESHSIFCMNHEPSGGDGAIMNYCSPWEFFSGAPDAPNSAGDSYQYLRWKFQRSGWLQ